MLLVIFKSFAPIRSAQNFCAMYGFHKSIKTKILSIQKSNSQLINGLAISHAEMLVGLKFNEKNPYTALLTDRCAAGQRNDDGETDEKALKQVNKGSVLAPVQ
jgi:hypothetical protein